MFNFYNPNQRNIVKDMLTKGDRLRDAYSDFDFEKLDAKQQQCLKMLSIYSRYRSRIEAMFEPEQVSNELKVMFLE
jgi:hypothetical protein